VQWEETEDRNAGRLLEGVHRLEARLEALQQTVAEWCRRRASLGTQRAPQDVNTPCRAVPVGLELNLIAERHRSRWGMTEQDAELMRAELLRRASEALLRSAVVDRVDPAKVREVACQ